MGKVRPRLLCSFIALLLRDVLYTHFFAKNYRIVYLTAVTDTASMATSTARAPGRRSMILQANCSPRPAPTISTCKTLSIHHTPFRQPLRLTLGHSAARSSRYGACCRCSTQRGVLHERPHRQLAPAPCCILLPYSRALQDHHGSQGNEARTPLFLMHVTDQHYCSIRRFPPTATPFGPKCSCTVSTPISASSKSRRAKASRFVLCMCAVC